MPNRLSTDTARNVDHFLKLWVMNALPLALLGLALRSSLLGRFGLAGLGDVLETLGAVLLATWAACRLSWLLLRFRFSRGP